MKEKIIRNSLRNILKNKPARFSMPGHKGKKQAYKLDVTEIQGADNLHNPKTILKEVEEKIAKIYGVKNSIMLTGSSTAGLQAAILSELSEGDKVLVPINAHRSIYPALAYSKAEPIYFKPEICNPGMKVTQKQIKKLIEKNPDIKAVILVSPDYYGNISEITEINAYLKSKNISLILDQAHGAHLAFINTDCGEKAKADYIIESTHKLLSAPSQTAILLINKPEKVSRLRKILRFIESTSPSYLLLMGLEEAIDEANKKAKDKFNFIYKAYDGFYNKQDENETIKLVKPSEVIDKSKFLFQIPNDKNLEERFITEFNIIPELVTGNYALFMTGSGTSQRDLNRLFGAIAQLNQEFNTEVNVYNVESDLEIFNTGLSLSEVILKEGRLENLNKTEGKICTDFIVPYPPGIPILIPGSTVTKRDINLINKLKEKDFEIIGLKENGNLSLEVLDEA